MIKKISFFLFLSFLVLPLARTGAQDLKDYSDQKRMFSIQIPSDWKAGDAWGLANFESPDNKDKQTVTVSLLALLKESKVEEMFERHVKGIEEEGIKIQDKGKTKMDSHKTMWVSYIKQAAPPYYSLQYLLVDGKRYYVITAETAVDSFSKHEASLRKIIESIRIQ
jgi:photosystem II reaction center protein PsbP